MRKKRILLCGEYSGLNSGYANWSRNLLNELANLDKYELAELACFCGIQDLQNTTSRWKIYANSVPNFDQRYSSYRSNTNNTYGQWRFDPVCLDFRPDIVIDFRDPWMFEYQSYSVFRKYFKWLIMPPVDSYPQKNEWITIFNNADLIIPYTNWAKNILSSYKHLNVHNQISPAGVDYTEFKPLAVNKKDFGLPDDKFIIGSVMRNQKRKLIPSLFELLQKMPDCILYLHTTYPELMGWNIPALLLNYQIYNRVYFTYKCRLCNKFFPLTFKGALTTCESCNKPSCGLAGTGNGIKDSELAQIYNLFDIYIQYAICEGFGMPQIEASACGLPVFSVDYSAMSEVVRSINGYAIPLKNLQYEMESGAQRAYPDIEKTIELINEYRNLPNETKFLKKQETRDLTIQNYAWKDIAKVWERAIDSMSVEDIPRWDDKNKYEMPDEITIDDSLDNYDFIKYICCEILQEPSLMKTQMIQHILYSLDHGVSNTGPAAAAYTKKNAAAHLEKYAQHKTTSEQIRTVSGKIKEDYIMVANGLNTYDQK